MSTEQVVELSYEAFAYCQALVEHTYKELVELKGNEYTGNYSLVQIIGEKLDVCSPIDDVLIIDKKQFEAGKRGHKLQEVLVDRFIERKMFVRRC